MKKKAPLHRLFIYGTGLVAILIFLVVKDNTTLTDRSASVETCNILPAPASVSMQEGILIMGTQSRIYFESAALKDIASLISRDIWRISGQVMEISSQRNKHADIRIQLSDKLEPEEYQIRIHRSISLVAGSIQAASNGAVSLAQLLISHAGRASFPKIELSDKPESHYRGLLLDVARKWHSIDNIKQVIETCRWYKINFLQLHLTDDQSFTFPSLAFPDLATPNRQYTLSELRDLDEFALARGVRLVPELEVPGHSSLMRKVAPFGLEGTHIINILNEDVYTALDTLVGEICSVFKASPYFHIGADECWMDGVGETEEEKAFMKTHNLENQEDAYNYFIVRMNELVKKHHKKTLVWEGFKGQGSANVKIPKDITVFAWESLYQRPDSLVANGYTVINASWKPLYIVPHRSWTPEYIYSWNMYRFENWWEIAPAFIPIQVEPTQQIIGAQMCAWENEAHYDLPAIQWRLPAMSDKIWIPQTENTFENFQFRYQVQDKKLQKIIYPFSLRIEGLLYPGFMGVDQNKPYQFKTEVWISTKPGRRDLKIRYTTDGIPPTANSPVLEGELKIKNTSLLNLQAFNEKNQLVGHTKILPLTRIPE